MEIGFNAQYLLDFLGVAGTRAVSLELKDAREPGPAAARAASGETDYRYVVMPMRL